MPLTHEQAVAAGRRGGLAPHIRRGKAPGVRRYGASVVVRMPEGLKEWYERRAQEQGIGISTLVREILQGNRAAITGNKEGLGQI